MEITEGASISCSDASKYVHLHSLLPFDMASFQVIFSCHYVPVSTNLLKHTVLLHDSNAFTGLVHVVCC